MPIRPSFSEVRAALVALSEAERAALLAELAPERLPAWLRRAAQLHHRDDLIRETARRWLAGQPITRQAKALAADLARYSTTSWPRDRALVELPDDASQRRRAFHSIMRAGAGNALGWRQLVNILQKKPA